MSWFDDPVAAALALPPLVLPLLIFGSALLEYVFPPYWGDTFVLLGFFLAGQGATTPSVMFAAALLGSILGSVAAYRLGHRYGLAVARKLTLRRERAPSRRVRELFERFGEKVLIANRFLPVVRGFLLYGAGAFGLRFGAVIFYCTLSNLAFIGLLMWAGLWTADSWPEIQAVFRQSNQLLGVVALILVLLAAGRMLWMSSRRGTEPGAQ